MHTHTPKSVKNAHEDILNLVTTNYSDDIEIILLNLHETAQREWRVDHEAQSSSKAGKMN